MNPLDFETYQTEARKTAVYPNIGQNLWYPGLGLGGESGEVQEQIKKVFRDDGGHVTVEREDKLVKELGDVLWYLANIASELRISLGLIAEMNIKKLQKRQAENKVHGEGDER